MKTSGRFFIKATAAGVGATAFTGLGSKEAGAIQANQVRKWDYEAGIVILGTGAAGFMTAITAHDQGPDQ